MQLQFLILVDNMHISHISSDKPNKEKTQNENSKKNSNVKTCKCKVVLRLFSFVFEAMYVVFIACFVPYKILKDSVSGEQCCTRESNEFCKVTEPFIEKILCVN
jgi:hypothetical protein